MKYTYTQDDIQELVVEGCIVHHVEGRVLKFMRPREDRENMLELVDLSHPGALADAKYLVTNFGENNGRNNSGRR